MKYRPPPVRTLVANGGQRHPRASQEPGSWRARPGRGHGPHFDATVAPGVAHRRRCWRRRRHRTPRAARGCPWRVRAPASSPSLQHALVALAWNTTAAAAGSCTEHRSLCRRAEPFRRRTSCGERGGVEDMLSRRPVAVVHKLAADGASEATTRQVIAGHEAERGEGGGRWSFWLGGMTSPLPCSPLNQVLHRGQHCPLMSLSK